MAGSQLLSATAPASTPDFDWLAFYFTKTFDENRWAIHYYPPSKVTNWSPAAT